MEIDLVIIRKARCEQIMKIRIYFLLATVALLSACQSTQHSGFVKENVVSDYALMLELASRPKTKDLEMMELFARRSYQPVENSFQLYYLPEGQENPINFLSIGNSFVRPLLPAAQFTPQELTISLMGPKTSL